VRHFHISDRTGKDEKSQEVPIGEGVMPIKEVMRLAKKENFVGFFSGQWWPQLGEPEVILAQFIGRLRQFEAGIG
jgi:sugar phosphate isomerase/epimerase